MLKVQEIESSFTVACVIASVLATNKRTTKQCPRRKVCKIVQEFHRWLTNFHLFSNNAWNQYFRCSRVRSTPSSCFFPVSVFPLSLPSVRCELATCWVEKTRSELSLRAWLESCTNSFTCLASQRSPLELYCLVPQFTTTRH